MENTHIKTEEIPVTSNSETATVAASNDNSNAVTSNSPTPTSSAFQPFQQLHEAVLAAVNSHNIPLSHQSFMEAVAAATNSVNSQAQTQQQEPQQQPQQQQPTLAKRQQSIHLTRPMTDAEYAKKESIRASNRERKKKWRIHNEERNKDNDLRCRVNKRANKLFGLAESANKAAWVQEEFEKRRQKRMDKERRKLIVNNVLSVPGSENNHNVAMPNIVGSGQIPNFYAPLPQIDTATAAKLLDFPTDLQRQLLEQLNNSMMNQYLQALTNGIQQNASETDEHKAQLVDQAIHNLTETSSSSHAESSNSNTTQSVSTSTEIPTTSTASTTTTSATNENATTPTMTATTTNVTTDAVPDSTLTNPTTDTQTITTTSVSTTPTSTAMEIDTAAPTTTSVETATTSSTTVNQEPQTNNNSSNTSDSSSGHNSPLDYSNKESSQNEIKEENKEEGKEEKKPEYPMDAVLTLMQLNAGWRQ